MDELFLNVSEYAGPDRWRWVLTEPGGRYVTDYQVSLDASCWQSEAFADLYGHLRWHAPPDRRIVREAEIMEQVGRWVSAQVLGPVAEALSERAPVCVRVIIPDEARVIAYRPLDLAWVDDRPLILHKVSLIMEIAGARRRRAEKPMAGPLRVLGLFSLPTGSTALNLRKERYELAQLLHRIAETSGRAIEAQMLQYGVTRERLTEEVEDGDGWDVVHISGHGRPGEFLLENADGTPFPVSSNQLAGWLEPLAGRVKLITVSACSSAALTARELLQLLGLTPAGSAEQPEPTAGKDPDADALAAELNKRLGCAVLGMRYPVVDNFALALSAALYTRLIGRRQPLASALSLALGEIAAIPASPSCPPLSMVTPTLFGSSAADLKLHAAPGSSAVFTAESVKLSGFPRQPERFVGRVREMAAASRVLAPESGQPGLVLHGMAGVGKTACAAELAYTHAHTFRTLVWHKAPEGGDDISGAFTSFALGLEGKIAGLEFGHLAGDQSRLREFLPQLTEYLEHHRVLIILDNAENLLTETGTWRDSRWALLADALTAHQGLSRLIITTRHRPAALDAKVHTQAVHALSRDEAVLLTRELPNLSALMDGTTMLGKEAGRELAVRIMAAAQGHPALLQLADAQAGDPARLRELAAAAEAVWSQAGRVPSAFFATRGPGAGADDYLRILRSWTDQIVQTLADAPRDLFCVLCCLEPADRISSVVEGNWETLRNRLGQREEPPGFRECLAVLTAQALTAISPARSGQSYEIHPEVAAAGRARAGADFQATVDSVLAEYWIMNRREAGGSELRDEASRSVVHAALHAVPYLIRREDWPAVNQALEMALTRDDSRRVVTKMLPVLRQALAASEGTVDEIRARGNLAWALAHIDPTESVRHMRDALTASLREHDYRKAGVTAQDLSRTLLQAGRAGEALGFAESAIKYIRQADLGPWTLLAGEISRLRALAVLGQMDQVIPEYRRLSDTLEHLPACDPRREAVYEWSIREQLLVVGMSAAIFMNQWGEALRLNSEMLTSMRYRDAAPDEIWRALTAGFGPLMKLGRLHEARDLLVKGREIFEQTADTRMSSMVNSSLAMVEQALDHQAPAEDLPRDALRYSYANGDIPNIVIGHTALGDALADTPRAGEAVAHYLTAALIMTLSGTVTGGESFARRAGAMLLQSAGTVKLPHDVAELCMLVGAVPGVKLDQLLERLCPTPGAVDRAWAHVLAAGKTREPTVDAAHFAAWEPVIAGILAADRGDPSAAEEIDAWLGELEWGSGNGPLVSALRRIRSGERDIRVLSALDGPAQVIAAHVLDVLDGRASVSVELWQATRIGPLLGDIVEAANGGKSAAVRASQDLSDMARVSHHLVLSRVLSRILAGDRDDSLLTESHDPVHQAVVTTVLKYIGSAAPENDTVPRNRKVPRNSPCPCGSGRKYKRCCGGPLTSTRLAMTSPPINYTWR